MDIETESNHPDFIAKVGKGIGEQSKLIRIGAAWNREDGGISLRLVGAQIVDSDVYLFPNESR